MTISESDFRDLKDFKGFILWKREYREREAAQAVLKDLSSTIRNPNKPVTLEQIEQIKASFTSSARNLRKDGLRSLASQFELRIRVIDEIPLRLGTYREAVARSRMDRINGLHAR